MPNIEGYTNLAYTDFSTDKAKDDAYMADQQKAQKVADTIRAKGLELGGTEFFEHKSRREVLGENLTNYTPAKFALNTSASRRIDNPKRYYAKKGIGKQTFFADTVERDSTRFLSENNDMTNHAVALDNYDFFLKHNDEIRANLARTMLAKLDLDMDTKKTLEDLLNGSQWKQASGEEIFRELKNRMRRRGQELSDRYMPLFKLLSKAEEINTRYEAFKQERLRAQNTVYEKMETQNDPLASLEENDPITKARIKELFASLRPLLSTSSDTLEQTLEAIRQKEEGGAGIEAGELLRLAGHDLNFMAKQSSSFMQELKAYEEKLKAFRELHAKSLETATKTVEQWAYKSKEYPIAMLAAITDKDYFLKHASEKEYRDVLASMQKEFSKILPESTNIKVFMRSYADTLRSKKDLFEHIYNPEKDTFNPQRQYMPLESVREHDTAGNILRDALYMEIVKHQDRPLFEEYYDRETQEEILTIPLDKEINEKKPRMDEVTDTYNAIMAVEKMTTGELSRKEASILFSSPLFQDSTVLNDSEVEGLREFGQDLAAHTKVLKSKKLVGTPSEHELKNSIQEMHYLGYARQLAAKLRPDEQEKNPIKRTSAFLNRNLFQNNKALYQLEECMKTALNPTTSAETIPSLSKNCIEKLKDAYDKEAQELSQSASMAKGWLAVSFVGTLENMMPVLAKSKRDAIHLMVDEMNRKIAEDSAYTNNARNDYERMARMMNIQNEQGRLANHIVASSHASEFRDEIEKEGLVRTLMQEHSKPHSLIFSNIYKTAVMPDVYQENKAEALKAEMEKLRNDYQMLREELILKAMKDEAYSDIAKEVERIELDNRLIETRLESSHLLDEIEKKQLTKTLEEGKRILEEKKEKIYAFAIDNGRYENISDSIQKVYDRTAAIVAELNQMEQSKEQAYKNRVHHNDENHRTEIDLQGLHGKEILSAIAMINSVKQDIDKQILDGIRNKSLKASELERLRKDRDKATRTIAMLHKEAMLDKDLFAEALAESLSKEHNISVNAQLLKQELGENGLSGRAVNHIIERSSDLARNQRRLIRSNLYDINTAYREMVNGKQIESRYANVVSSALASIQGSRLFDAMKESNDNYVAIDNIGDGKSHIKSAKGELGYYIEYIDNLEMMIETAQNEEEKSIYREMLSDIIQEGEEIHDQSGINFGEYRDIAIKQAHSGNDLERVNTALHQRSTELNRH